MRISDWSSDVCSSDLLIVLRRGRAELAVNPLNAGAKAARQRKIIGRADRLFQRVGATRVLRSGGNGDHPQQYAGVRGGRSEGRRVGKVVVSTFSAWMSPDHEKNNSIPRLPTTQSTHLHYVIQTSLHMCTSLQSH